MIFYKNQLKKRSPSFAPEVWYLITSFYFTFHYFNFHSYTCYTGRKIIWSILRYSYSIFLADFLMHSILPVVTTPWEAFPPIGSKFIALKLYHCHVIIQGSLCSCNQLEISKFQPPPFDQSTCQDEDVNPSCQCLIMQSTLSTIQNPTILNPIGKRNNISL